MNIFLVENHRDTLRYVQMYLESLGHTVRTARTMDSALAAIPTAECDVLVCDLGLPDGTGWDLLKNAKFPRPVFAIAISGYGTEADRKRSKEAGFRRHLVKPFGGGDLKLLLDEAAGELRR